MTKHGPEVFFLLMRKSFIQISQKTLVSLFPFFHFQESFAIALSVFSDRGYIHQFRWIAGCRDQAYYQVLINFSNFLGGLGFGPLASDHFAGKYSWALW